MHEKSVKKSDILVLQNIFKRLFTHAKVFILSMILCKETSVSTSN